MSTAGRRNLRRTVVPRWRSLLNTPTLEILPLVNFPEHPPTTADQFDDLVKFWRTGNTAEDFVDIMDAGIAAGNRKIAVEGARGILAQEQPMQEMVIERASTIIGHQNARIKYSKTPIDESLDNIVFEKIRRLKRSLWNSPRNTLAHVEIARLYTRLGQFRSAEEHLRQALFLNADDRYVLRSATRFFTMVDAPDEALKSLRQSDIIRFDPWIQSAELAAAEIDGVSSKFAKKPAKALAQKAHITTNVSELWIGWVSKLVDEEMPRRKARKLLRSGILRPTENALAQAIWLADQYEIGGDDFFPQTKFTRDAHEAKALSAVEAGNFITAEKEATKWFIDQPFQARAAITLAFVNFVHLFRYQEAALAAATGLELHPNEWLLWNLATLSYIYLSDEENARKYIIGFEKHAVGNDAKAYVIAAKGLFEFEFGDPQRGYDYYTETIQICRSDKRNHLVMNASIYLYEAIARKFGIYEKDYKKLNEIIEKAVSNQTRDKRDHEQIWASRKKVIRQFTHSSDDPTQRQLFLDIAKVENDLLEL